MEHDIACGAAAKATASSIMANETVVQALLAFGSRGAVDVACIGRLCEMQGFTFDHVGGGLKSAANIKRNQEVRRAADLIYECDLAGVLKMLASLRGYVDAFGKMKSNGESFLSTMGDAGDIFEDMFIIYESSMNVGAGSSTLILILILDLMVALLQR